MKNKTTYEMEDVMNLITRDLADKGLAPDPGSMEIWTKIDGARVSTKEIEVEVNVSWVGIPAQGDGDPTPTSPRLRARRVPDPEPDTDTEQAPDLLDEAPRPGTADALEIGIDDVTAASAKITRSGGEGPFAPKRVKRRLMNDESTDWPGNPRSGGR